MLFVPWEGARIGLPMTLIGKALVWLSILGPWYHVWYCAWYAGKFKNARSAEAQRDGASSAWDSAGVAAVAFVVAAIIIWAASGLHRIRSGGLFVPQQFRRQRHQSSERRKSAGPQKPPRACLCQHMDTAAAITSWRCLTMC